MIAIPLPLSPHNAKDKEKRKDDHRQLDNPSATQLSDDWIIFIGAFQHMGIIRYWNYNGHGYGLVAKDYTWDEAKAYANSKNGYLVEINDYGENNFLKSILVDGLTNIDRDLNFDYQDKTLEYVPDKYKAIDGGDAPYAWTGGNDKDLEGTWLWYESNKPISLDAPEWGSGAGVQEPDNTGGNQNYLGFALGKWPAAGDTIGTYGEWNDIKGANKLYSIVEFDYEVDERTGEKVDYPDPGQPGSLPYNPNGYKPPANEWARERVDKTYDAPYDANGYSYEYNVYDLGGDRYGVERRSTGKINEVTDAQYVKFKDGDKYVDRDIKPSFDLIKGYDDVTGQCFRLYSAAFGRHPDYQGLDYWITQNKAGNINVKNTAYSFVNAPEFKDRYGTNPTNAEYINGLYNNVLGRNADAGVYAFWNDAMGAGASKGDVLHTFSESPENKGLFGHTTGWQI